jgi:hypothetical protein
VACGGGGGNKDDGNSSDPDVWHFRGINAIDDAPGVQFYIDDTAVATADYGHATDYKPAHTGERPVRVAIRNASKLGSDPGYTDIGDEESYQFDGPTDYTLVSAGTVADPQQFLITDTSRATVEDNQVEYQIINAATAAPSPLAVYITAPGASIDEPQLVDTLAPGEYSEKKLLDLEIASGDEEDDPRSSTVRFEVFSGATRILRSGTVTVSEASASSTRLLVVVADNIAAAGSSPIKLMVFGGTAAASALSLINIGDPGELRFANVSPDAGPADLIAGSSASDTLATNIDFGGASPYVSLEAGLYNTIATPAGNPGSFLFVNAATVSAGRSYTMYGQGSGGDLRGLLYDDERRSVPTEAHFRFLHAAPSEGTHSVSVYLTKRGEELDFDATTAPTPNVSTLAYRTVSSQLTLDGGAYDAYFTPVGSENILLGPVPLDLTDGSVQTLVLTDDPQSVLTLVPFNDARE